MKFRKKVRKIMELADRHPIILKPGLHHIEMAHDDWCDLLKQKGECNCNPSVRYIATEGNN